MKIIEPWKRRPEIENLNRLSLLSFILPSTFKSTKLEPAVSAYLNLSKRGGLITYSGYPWNVTWTSVDASTEHSSSSRYPWRNMKWSGRITYGWRLFDSRGGNRNCHRQGHPRVGIGFVDGLERQISNHLRTAESHQSRLGDDLDPLYQRR